MALVYLHVERHVLVLVLLLVLSGYPSSVSSSVSALQHEGGRRRLQPPAAACCFADGVVQLARAWSDNAREWILVTCIEAISCDVRFCDASRC
eukprot:COSAG02_NODE_2844_length_7905_cov_33.004356_1_plen_93_part_00